MRNQQLKESLLGWGGYEDKQDKIYLENQAVYCRGNRQTSTVEVRGAFYKWGATVSGTTYYVYTSSLTPSVGDPVFVESNSTQIPGRVLKYAEGGLITEHILIYLGNDWPITPTTMFYYEEAIADKTFITNVSSESIYPINIDGSQSDKKFTIYVDYNSTTSNEKWFFDKKTQCLIRTAFQEYSVDTYASSGIGTLKQLVWEAYDPNTGIPLDQHVAWAFSNQNLATNCRKENISQGFYSFYCNGIVRKATSVDDGFAHTPTVFTYSPRQRKVFAIPVGDVIDIQNPIGTASVPTKDMFFGIYNQTLNLDALDDVVVSFYIPAYNGDTTDTVTGRFVVIDISLETNPISMVPRSIVYLTSGGPGNVMYTNEKYLNTPSSSLNMGFADSQNLISRVIRYNNIKSDHEYPYTFYTSVISVINPNSSGVCVPDVNMCTDISYTLMYTRLSSEGWFGRINFMDLTAMDDHLLTSEDLETPITNQALFPRFFSGSKYNNTITKIEEAGEICKTGSKTYYKVYSDPCYGAIVSAYTSLPQFKAIIIGETEESVMYYDNDDSTRRIGGYVDYNGKRWYYGFGDSIANYNIENPKNLSFIYTETLDLSDTQTVAFFAVKCLVDLLYTNATVVKDYYSDGAEQLIYKLYSMGRFTPITIYDSVSGSETTYIQRPQPEIPFSERHMVFTSTSQVSAAQLPRYINLVSIEQDNTNYIMKTVTEVLDCNSNTEYLADNTSSNVTANGFAIPPVAVGDGETTPEPTGFDLHYYAWKRTVGSTIEYIYTNSMDAGVVVGKAYFFKDNGNHFYRQSENNYTVITSLTATYITTRAGVEYTRAQDYDWDYEEGTTGYVPSYLNAWGA